MQYCVLNGWFLDVKKNLHLNCYQTKSIQVDILIWQRQNLWTGPVCRCVDLYDVWFTLRSNQRCSAIKKWNVMWSWFLLFTCQSANRGNKNKVDFLINMSNWLLSFLFWIVGKKKLENFDLLKLGFTDLSLLIEI